MKKKKIIIIAAIVLAASVGIGGALVACNGSGSETGSTESKVDESTEGSVESEKVSEETSSPESSQSESSAESSKDSDKSKQESSKTESSKQESSKKEASKQESSKVESSKESSKPSSPAQVPITSLSLPKSSLQLRVGESVSLEPGVMPSNATERSLVAHYSNSNIAYYDGHTVTANGVGSSTVGISTEDGRYRVDIEVVVSANSVNSGNSSNSGNNGSTSKPSSNTSKPSGTQNRGGSSSKPSSDKIWHRGQIPDLDEDSIENTSKPSESTQSSSVSSSTAKKWVASEHEKDKVYSTGGYEMYECPEIVQYINYYRRQAGLNEVKWDGYTEENAKERQQWFDALPEDEKEEIRIGIPEAFVNGVYSPKEDIKDATSIERDSLEYCIVEQTLAHGNFYSTGTSNCNQIIAEYDPKGWVDNFKKSPLGHWSIIMKKSAERVYAVYSMEHGVLCMLIY